MGLFLVLFTCTRGGEVSMISKNNMVSVVMVMMALLDWYCPNKNCESHAPTPSILFFTPLFILLIILYIFQFIYICFTKLPT